MSPEIISAASGLIGAGIGGFVTYLVTKTQLAHATAGEKRERALTRFEGAFDSLNKASGYMNGLLLRLSAFTRAQQPWALESEREQLQLLNGTNVHLVVSIYAHHLSDSHDDLSRSIVQFINALSEGLGAVAQSDREAALVRLQATYADVSKHVVTLQRQLAKAARSL